MNDDVGRTYRPYECHKPFLIDALSWRTHSAKELFLFGAVGAGKTTLICQTAMALAGMLPGYLYCATPLDITGVRHTKILLVRNTYREIRDNLCDTLIGEFPGIIELEGLKKGLHAPSCVITREINGEKIIVDIRSQALDDKNSERSLKGAEFTIAIVDEATEIKEEHYAMLRTRMGRFPAKDKLPHGTPRLSMMLCPTNTASPSNWVKKQWEREKEMETGTVRFHELPAPFMHTDGEVHLDGRARPVRNPDATEYIETMPDNYYESMRLSNPVSFKRLCLCVWTGDDLGAKVFPDFAMNRHVESHVLGRREKNSPVYVGLDLGAGTLSPAAVYMQRIGTQMCVLKEDAPFKNQRISIDEFVQRQQAIVADFFHGYSLYWYGDPAGNVANAADDMMRTTFDLFQAKSGYLVQRCPVSTQNKVALNESLERLLTHQSGGRSSIIFDRDHCHGLINALDGEYCYEKKGKQGRYHTAPTKNHPVSDLVEALLYGVSSSGEFHAMKHMNAMAAKRAREKTMGEQGFYETKRSKGDLLMPAKPRNEKRKRVHFI